MANTNNFLKELQRRNVFKVGAAYIIVAWLLIQVADIIFPALNLPDWTITLITVLILFGFPIILLFAWAFELTPEGVKFTKEVDPTDSITGTTGKRFNNAIITLLLLAVIYMALDNYVLVEETPEPVFTETEEAKPVEQSVNETPATENKKSVAVLPFANRSEEKKDSFFVDGLHDDLLTHLSKISDMKVISRTSVMRYRETDKSMKAIGEELGVATVMEGGVQRAGNQVRINVQLIDADTDEHLWAEIYDRELTAANIFAIQSEIATAIASALRATLSPEEQERIAAVPTQNLQAYEAYLLGKQNMVGRTSEGLAKAVGNFQQAVDLDPDFALAYVGLADTYQLQIQYSGSPKKQMQMKAEAAINRALALDDKLGEAYASLGLLNTTTNNYDAADAAFKKALALNPNYATTYHWYGLLYRDYIGNFEKAIVINRKGAELDPLSPILKFNMLSGYQALGRFSESRAETDKILAVAPGSPLGYSAKANLDWYVSGQLDKAVQWFNKAYRIDSTNPELIAGQVLLLLDLGDNSQAECWADRAGGFGQESFLYNHARVMLYLVRGDKNEALSHAEKTLRIEPRSVYPISLATLTVHDMQEGEYRKARARYENHYPELFMQEPRLYFINYRAAISLAGLLKKNGEGERADRLFSRALEFIQNLTANGTFGYTTTAAQVYALQGEKQKALSSLRQVIDTGWRWYWNYELLINPNLDSIRNEPEFQSMVAEVRADMASQLERLKASQQAGDTCVPSNVAVNQ